MTLGLPCTFPLDLNHFTQSWTTTSFYTVEGDSPTPPLVDVSLQRPGLTIPVLVNTCFIQRKTETE